ncbi:transporter substrate-binding domain-containing protein [Plebeiibacterium marinum]|uniref:Transporter substrate-binding domain-containing protein n=1 Tax=Plebeiibacterium marinum TaxID=2992111 RepID=A0AAE3SKG2_9BACT|nr:transporter substrate-binding domain-containing protein [Plebeiobacterium marinum]MCW3806825.1 transporter substrate-binding domain-containing protein [Plebeiobacterium marinum]
MRVVAGVITLLLMLLVSCDEPSGKKVVNNIEEEVAFDLDEIHKRGRLIVVTDYNSTNYFIYKGTPMGYQLELLNEFCNNLGVKLEVIVSNDVEKNINDLRSGKIDLIAQNLAVTRERGRKIQFTEPHTYSRQVLVQRIEDKDQEKARTGFNDLIRNQLDLAGKTIYVQKGSSYVTRLNNLSDEIGDSINVVEIPDYEAEQLIGLVAEGEISYTICDEILARVNKNYYENIDIETPISFPQKMAWGVRKSSKDLLQVINNWLIRFTKSAKYNIIYKKYFLNRRSTHIVDAGYNSLKGGLVSEFDDIIKKESENIDWDWKLIAALIYQESRFLPEIKSWAGAQGLMQLMPATAQKFGVNNITSPQENIRGGIKFIKWLDKRMALRVDNPEERLKFVLASYNVGLGHVLDAMRLAEKNGKDPKVWEGNVDYYLLNKSQPKYFNDPVVEFGYCRGKEPYLYVNEILERYEHYKNLME